MARVLSHIVVKGTPGPLVDINTSRNAANVKNLWLDEEA